MKTIIFDFSGVIVNDVYWDWLKANVPDLEQKREYFEKLSREVDREIISSDEFEEGIARETRLQKDQVWPVFRNNYLINERLLAEIRALKNKYKIGLLTNFNHIWLERLLDLHTLREYFDEILISSLHKLAKPDPEFFLKALELLKTKAEEAVFFDDRQSNVDAGNSLGIKSFLYVSVEEFKKALRSIGAI